MAYLFLHWLHWLPASVSPPAQDAEVLDKTQRSVPLCPDPMQRTALDDPNLPEP